MRNLKRVLSLALALVMVLGMMVITTSAADFTDADEITYQEAVDVMSAIGVIDGVEAADGSFAFNPTEVLTREQAAKIVCYLLMGKTNAEKLVGSGVFTDVKATRWSAGAIDYCASLDILDGNGDGTFNPTGKLTAVQYGKMLLCALGYDAEIEGYVGKNWATNIASDMVDIGLDVDGVEMDAQLTREQAAQMTLQALKSTMVKYDDKGTDITVGDTSVKIDASEAEAVTNIYDADGNVLDYTTATATGDGTLQFVEKYFSNLTLGAGIDDDFGRPSAYTWRLFKNGRTYIVYNEFYEVMTTYTEGFNAKEVKALKADDYTFDATEIVVNGADTGITDVNALAGREYVGTAIELYNIDKDTEIEKIVVVQGYLTKVLSVTSTYDDVTLNNIKLAVYNPWAPGDVVNVTISDYESKYPTIYDYLTADYGKNDYLVTYWYGADVDAIGDNILDWHDVAATVLGDVTATRYETTYFSGTITVDGTAYTLATGYAEWATLQGSVGGALTLGYEYTLILDEDGYVIGAIPTEEAKAATHYAIVLDYASANAVSANNLTGAPAKEAYENVQLYTSEGKVEILGTAFKANAQGVITQKIAAGVSNGDLVAYKLDDAGKIKELTIADVNDTAALNGAHTKGDTFKIVSGGSNYATDKTVIFVTKTGTLTGRGDIAAYNGYASVPSATYAAGVAIDAAQKNAGAAVVTVSTANLPGSTTKAQYVVLNGAPTVTAAQKQGEYVYTYEAVLNGVKTSVFATGSSNVAAGSEDVICTVTFDSETGAIASITPVVMTGTEITDVNTGFYVVGGNAVKTDEDTVYYQVNGRTAAGNVVATTGMTVTDGITLANAMMGETFVVYEYAVAVNGDGIATAVIYFVYQA